MSEQAANYDEAVIGAFALVQIVLFRFFLHISFRQRTGKICS